MASRRGFDTSLSRFFYLTTSGLPAPLLSYYFNTRFQLS